VDLRRLSCEEHAAPAMETAKSQRQRGATLLAPYRFLRKERGLPLTDDPSWRDALTIQAGTAWQVTQVERFAVGGTIEPLPRNAQQEGVAGVLVCPRHKSGDPHRTRVSAAVLEAAKRLLSHGSFATGHEGRGGTAHNRAIRAACAAVKRPDGGIGIPPFSAGMLRHSVATHAVNACGSVQAVAEFLGHRTKKTTARFYSTFAFVAKVPTLRRSIVSRLRTTAARRRVG
jgi:integrase